MVPNSRYKVIHIDGSAILHDVDIISSPTLALFNREQQGDNQWGQTGMGRAKVVYFSLENKNLENRNMVLKHYFRGGLLASFLKDRYLGISIENSRSFKEWRLLKKMKADGLPVPDAIAARVEKKMFFYRADLITEEIENIKTLADLLTSDMLDIKIWNKVGACIESFHEHNIYHADLNARNILVADNGDIYLIDFDNSYVRADSRSWKMANLARLKRSLLKFKRNTTGFNFEEADWINFLKGYGDEVSKV